MRRTNFCSGSFSDTFLAAIPIPYHGPSGIDNHDIMMTLLSSGGLHPVSGKRRQRKLSIARELLILASNAETLRLAAERNIVPSRSETLRDFAYAMAGSLLVLRDRLRLAESVAVGNANPSLLITRSNLADDSEEGPGIFPEWSPEQIVERREAERRGAENRLEWAKRDQRPQTFILHKNPSERSDT